MAKTFPAFYREKQPVISFEVFPPRDPAAEERFWRVLPELVNLRPDFITVTYGAMGSTRDRTIEIAARVKAQFGLETACHLTCVGASRGELTEIITEIYSRGIRNIVALRGDPPKGETEFRPPADGFSHANELVAHIRQLERENNWERLGIAVAGYPEKHQEAPDMDTDLRYLKQKVETGADVVITQLFFDNRDFYRFRERAQAIGIQVPIVPGLMPILSARQIRRITTMCGASIPPPLAEELARAEGDDALAEQIGVRQCIEQASDLLRNGVPGIHFYVLNRSSHMRAVMAALRPVIEEVLRVPEQA